MANKIDKQQVKADLRHNVQQWLCTHPDIKYSDGKYYKVICHKTKTVEEISRVDIDKMMYLYAQRLCEAGFGGIGREGKLWESDARNVFHHVDAIFSTERAEDDVVAVGDTPMDGNYESRPYAVNRLPIDLNLPKTIARQDWDAALEELMTRLPEFYQDLKSRMVSPEMWNILTCFFGRVISEDTPSEQFVYWYGEGGDGKGSLTELFFRRLKSTACPISHDYFESRFGAGLYGDKRFVRIDEVGPGNFFTERVKEITGGAEFISVEKKGKDAETVHSRLALMFTSNFSPAFDGSMAQRRRLRVVQCHERTSPARDVKNELEASFDVFLAYCLINYERHGKKIPENEESILKTLIEEGSMSVDLWIERNFEYCPGGFMAPREIQAVFEDSNKNPHIKYKKMMRRFKDVLQAQSYDGGIVMTKSTNGVRGWHNIRKKEQGIAFSNVLKMRRQTQ